MFNMFGTRTMNFYSNDCGRDGPLGSYTYTSTNLCVGGGGSSNSSAGSRNSKLVNFNSPIYSFGSSTLDFITRARKSLWIQLLILLILLPNPGSEVGGEPQPQNLHPYQQQGQRIPVNHNNNSAIVSTTSISSNSETLNVTTDALADDDNPFENNTFSNTTVPIGDTAFLKCTARNLGERSVIWIRRRDMHIISVGKNTYTNDGRFHVLNIEGSDDWVLQIKYIQKRDNGTYECQVSTGKGIASYVVHVFVAVPEAFILGNGEYHIQEGSTINLVCIVEKSPKPPDYIFWYHNERMINYDKDRNLRIQTETGSKTHSRLIIENAQVADSGNYTCHISNADPASTLVYISQGDKMAAIQRRKSSEPSLTNLSDFLPFLELLSVTFLSLFG